MARTTQRNWCDENQNTSSRYWRAHMPIILPKETLFQLDYRSCNVWTSSNVPCATEQYFKISGRDLCCFHRRSKSSEVQQPSIRRKERQHIATECYGALIQTVIPPSTNAGTAACKNTGRLTTNPSFQFLTWLYRLTLRGRKFLMKAVLKGVDVDELWLLTFL